MMRLPERWQILAGCAAILVLGVALRPLLPIDETRYLSVAWEMRLGDHWIVPFKNGAPYDHKPPLLFWLINLVWLPGVSDFTGRLVAPGFSLAMLWGTGRLSDLMGLPRHTGTAAMLILATLGPFLFFGGETAFDTMLGCAVLLSVAMLWRIARAGGQTPGGWAALGAALAFGLMSKGPVIFVHVLPPLVALGYWSSVARLRIGGLLIALTACAGLVSLWLIPALITGGPAYREAVLWTQTAGRTVSSFAHAEPVWYYLPLIPALVFPWGWLPRFWRRIKADDAERLLWVSALGPLVLFSLISGKQLQYLVPELPFVAILLARRWPDALPRPWGPVAAAALLAIAILAAGFGAFGQDAATLFPWAVAALVALIILGACWLALIRAGRVWLLAPAIITAVNLAYTVGPAGDLMSAEPVARRLKPADGHIALVSPEYHAEFQFAGRLQHPVALLDTPQDISRFSRSNPDGLIIAELTGPNLPDWPPRERLSYRSKDWAIWSPEDREK